MHDFEIRLERFKKGESKQVELETIELCYFFMKCVCSPHSFALDKVVRLLDDLVDEYNTLDLFNKTYKLANECRRQYTAVMSAFEKNPAYNVLGELGDMVQLLPKPVPDEIAKWMEESVSTERHVQAKSDFLIAMEKTISIFLHFDENLKKKLISSYDGDRSFPIFGALVHELNVKAQFVSKSSPVASSTSSTSSTHRSPILPLPSPSRSKRVSLQKSSPPRSAHSMGDYVQQVKEQIRSMRLELYGIDKSWIDKLITSESVLKPPNIMEPVETFLERVQKNIEALNERKKESPYMPNDRLQLGRSSSVVNIRQPNAHYMADVERIRDLASNFTEMEMAFPPLQRTDDHSVHSRKLLDLFEEYQGDAGETQELITLWNKWFSILEHMDRNDTRQYLQKIINLGNLGKQNRTQEELIYALLYKSLPPHQMGGAAIHVSGFFYESTFLEYDLCKRYNLLLFAKQVRSMKEGGPSMRTPSFDDLPMAHSTTSVSFEPYPKDVREPMEDFEFFIMTVLQTRWTRKLFEMWTWDRDRFNIKYFKGTLESARRILENEISDLQKRPIPLQERANSTASIMSDATEAELETHFVDNPDQNQKYIDWCTKRKLGLRTRQHRRNGTCECYKTLKYMCPEGTETGKDFYCVHEAKDCKVPIPNSGRTYEQSDGTRRKYKLPKGEVDNKGQVSIGPFQRSS